MKIALIGSRTVPEKYTPAVREILIRHFPSVAQLVSGGAKGADSMVHPISAVLSLKDPVVFPVDQEKVREYTNKGVPYRVAYGKEAFARNGLIAAEAEAGLAIVDKPLSESKGTADTVRRLLAKGKKVFVYKIGEDGLLHQELVSLPGSSTNIVRWTDLPEVQENQGNSVTYSASPEGERMVTINTSGIYDVRTKDGHLAFTFQKGDQITIPE